MVCRCNLSAVLLSCLNTLDSLVTISSTALVRVAAACGFDFIFCRDNRSAVDKCSTLKSTSENNHEIIED